ncbi:helix-turn-helix domain-containing protein [Citrobacter farmeri]|nr:MULTISPECIES: helix-turn-helix domain-containing protein [Citrobacter]ELK6621885.1 helix-turn-helix domain-containing protein [Citrobacter amalonaticus]MBC6535028.1 helix-turn-helix domain-containing protein [Citrobacter amalonaticus]MBJ8743494.1 helix-turn-helix domain-containing protein [Citrobacter farmeri]MBJ8757650.1 helix-turn-helix domain-containing protein [Citrobacter farmeri]MBJ9018236.1 helix-turn-helix domain-containing protein [Citrobacter farmeri]
MTMPGERIRARRKDLKLTQRALAKLVKVAHVTISQWETGDSEPGGKNLFALSNALQCSPTWILYGDESATPGDPVDTPPALDEREIELLSLFSALPESEKERHLNELREKVDGFNRLFEELLQARKQK